MLLLRVLLWNIHTRGQYSNCKFDRDVFMLSFQAVPFMKQHNRGRVLRFWLALWQILFSCSVKHNLLSVVTASNFFFTILSSFYHHENIFYLLIVGRRWHRKWPRCGHTIFIKRLKNVLFLHFKFFFYKINIFVVDLRCNIINKMSDVSWLNGFNWCKFWKRVDAALNLGICQKAFLTMCRIC